MSKTKQELGVVLAIAAWCAWFGDVWWWAGLQGLTLGTFLFVLNRLPLTLQIKHTIALITICAVAAGPRWWMGALMGAGFCSVCILLGWMLDRAVRKAQKRTL